MTKNGNYGGITSFYTPKADQIYVLDVVFYMIYACSLINAIHSPRTVPDNEGRHVEVQLYQRAFTVDVTGEKLCLPLVVCAAGGGCSTHTLHYVQKSHSLSCTFPTFFVLMKTIIKFGQVLHCMCIATAVNHAVYCLTRNIFPIAAFECRRWTYSVYAVSHKKHCRNDCPLSCNAANPFVHNRATPS